VEKDGLSTRLHQQEKVKLSENGNFQKDVTFRSKLIMRQSIVVGKLSQKRLNLKDKKFY